MGQYKCCCCIPVRAGVLIIALLSAALYIAATVGLFMSKPSTGLTYQDVEIDMRVVNGIYYTSIAVSIIFALAALFGVLGSVTFYFATAISAYATRLRRTNMHEKLRNLEDFPEPPSKTEFF
ncbi:hypothetical protein MBANPS3_009041 [Mucor bainieri]